MMTKLTSIIIFLIPLILAQDYIVEDYSDIEDYDEDYESESESVVDCSEICKNFQSQNSVFQGKILVIEDEDQNCNCKLELVQNSYEPSFINPVAKNSGNLTFRSKRGHFLLA